MNRFLKAAFAAIDDVFSDTSVDQSTTIDRMEQIIEHCKGNIETLNELAEDEDDLEAGR